MVKIKPSKEFQSLYNQASRNREDILCYVSKTVGYARMWVEKHLGEAIGQLSSDEQIEINKKIKYNDLIIRYAWDGWYYRNWKRYADYIMNPAIFQISYDIDKKIITIKEIGILTKVLTKLKKLVKGVK